MVVDALLRMKAGAKKRFQEKEAQLWGEVKPPFLLKNFLEGLTKHDLTTIRQNLNLKGVSNLKKPQLIEALEKQIGPSMKKVVSLFDHNQYKLIKKIITNNGIFKWSFFLSKLCFIENGDWSSQVLLMGNAP